MKRAYALSGGSVPGGLHGFTYRSKAHIWSYKGPSNLLGFLFKALPPSAKLPLINSRQQTCK